MGDQTITAVDGLPLVGEDTIDRAWTRHRPGEAVSLAVVRPGEPEPVNVRPTFRAVPRGSVVQHVARQVRQSLPAAVRHHRTDRPLPAHRRSERVAARSSMLQFLDGTGCSAGRVRRYRSVSASLRQGISINFHLAFRMLVLLVFCGFPDVFSYGPQAALAQVDRPCDRGISLFYPDCGPAG